MSRVSPLFTTSASVGLLRRATLSVLALTVTSLPAALAAPSLPSSAVAAQAVKAALAPVQSAAARPAPVKAAPVKAAPVKAAPVKVVAGQPVAKKPTPAAVRAQGVTRAAVTPARSTGRSATVHSTAYNSTPGQTDSTPFITATGTRVRSGVVALSRDLLGRFPYGTRITIEDTSGRYSNFLRGRVFVVEDTMHPRIGNTVDVWMGTRSEAMAWGSRSIRITAVR